jgi:hypothetical protein
VDSASLKELMKAHWRNASQDSTSKVTATH